MRKRLVTSLLLLGFSAIANACSCVKLTSPCDKGWNSGETIFFGKVSAFMDDEGQPVTNGSGRLSDREVHFTSVEFFRGGDKTAREAVIFTGSGGGDCGYPFVAGMSYLVYAFTNNGRLMTGTCSETAPEVMVSGVLRELRALRDIRHVDDLFGTVGIAPNYGGWEDLIKTRPLAEVPVHAEGKRGRRFITKTDEHGAYLFVSLPPGKYRVNVDLPAGLVMQPYGNDQLLRAEIKRENTGAGCRIDVFPRKNDKRYTHGR